jgi:hypothetical protein
MDNTAKTNKNQIVMAFLASNISLSKFMQVRCSFLLAGHTKVLQHLISIY